MFSFFTSPWSSSNEKKKKEQEQQQAVQVQEQTTTTTTTDEQEGRTCSPMIFETQVEETVAANAPQQQQQQPVAAAAAAKAGQQQQVQPLRLDTATSAATAATTTLSAATAPAQQLRPLRLVAAASTATTASAATAPAGSNSVHFPPLPSRRSFSDNEDNMDVVANANNNVGATAATAIEPPNETQRLRSLSKVFTNLESATLPSYQTMIVDQLEYILHIVLLETDQTKIPRHIDSMNKCIKALRKETSSMSPSPGGSGSSCIYLKKGRIFSRLHIAALASDLSMVQVADNDGSTHQGSDKQQQPLEHIANWTPEQWNKLIDTFQNTKSCLLRKDANSMTFDDDDDENAESPDDEQLAQHSMMTTDYNDVLDLLKVHKALAILSLELEDAETDGEVRHAVNGYMERLVEIFPATTEPDKEDSSSPTDDDDSMLEHAKGEEEFLNEQSELSQTPTSNVPTELNSFVLTDLYSPKQSSSRQKSRTLAERLLDHIDTITMGSNSRHDDQNNLPGLYTWSTLQQKMRALLIKWSESILDMPALVQLGYGGVPTAIVTSNSPDGAGVLEEDDVSSWGDMEQQTTDPHHHHHHHQRQPNNTHKPMMRSRSLSRLVSAHQRGQPITLTDSEREWLDILAAIHAQQQQQGNNVQQGHREEQGHEVRRRRRRQQQEQPSREAQAPQIRKPPAATASQPLTRKETPKPKERTRLYPQEERVKKSPPARTAAVEKNRSVAPDSQDSAKSSEVPKKRRLYRRPKKRAEKEGRSLFFPSKSSSATADIVKVGRQDEESREERVFPKRARRLDDDSDDSAKENSPKTPQKKVRKTAEARRLEWSGSEEDHSPVNRPGARRDTDQHRSFFSKDEIDAIREGVIVFGKGKWQKIRDNDPRLANRTGPQVKDKYRNMKKNGEIF